MFVVPGETDHSQSENPRGDRRSPGVSLLDLASANLINKDPRWIETLSDLSIVLEFHLFDSSSCVPGHDIPSARELWWFSVVQVR